MIDRAANLVGKTGRILCSTPPGTRPRIHYWTATSDRYYGLASGAVAVESAPGRFRRNMPNPIPVAVLARLAVDHSWQHRDIGHALFRDAVRRVVQAADAIGIRGIVVHAISEEARNFYLALGFDPQPIDEGSTSS